MTNGGTRAVPGANVEEHMAKFIQICASSNDLFGLDDEGVVFQYNFNTKGWVKLDLGGMGRDTGPPSERATAPPRPKSSAGPS